MFRIFQINLEKKYGRKIISNEFMSPLWLMNLMQIINKWNKYI